MSEFKLECIKDIPDESIEIIKELSEQYPIMINGFKECLVEEFIIFCEKQHAYGPGNIALGTQLTSDKEILNSLRGIWFRMSDKIQRLFNMLLVRDTLETTHESAYDSYLDLSVYGKISRLVMNKKWIK